MAQLFDSEELSLELSIKVSGSAEVEKTDATIKRLSGDFEEATKRSQATVDSFKLLNQQAADLTRNATSASTAIASVRAVSQAPGSRVDLDNERRFLEQVQRVNRSAVVGLTQESRPQAPSQQVLAQVQLPPPQSAPQPPVARPGPITALAPIALATPEQSRALELEQQKTDRLAQSRARLMLLEARTTDAQAHPASLTIAGGKEPPQIVGIDRVLRDLDGALVNRVANIVKGFGNPRTAGQFLGSGAEAAVFDIGRGRVLKVRPEFDEQEAAKRQGRMRQVEAALGPFGNRAIAQETYSNEAGALSLEVFKKMRTHEAGVDASRRIAENIYKKTGVLTDFYGSGNYGQAQVGGRLKVIDSGFGIVGATQGQAEEHFEFGVPVPRTSWFQRARAGIPSDPNDHLRSESERIGLREEARISRELRQLGSLSGLVPPEPDRRRPATQQESDWAHLQLPVHRGGGTAYAVPQPARERPVPVREPNPMDLSAMSAGGSVWSSTYEPPVPSPPKVALHPAFRPSRMGLATQEEVEAAFQKMAPEAATYYREKGWEEPHGFLEGTQKSIAAGGISREVLGNLVNSGVHIGLRRPEDVYGARAKNWSGVYDRKTKEINVDPQRGSVRTMLHEVGHAVEDATRFSGNLDTPSNFGTHINPKAYSTPQLEQERFAETFANRYHPGDSTHNTSRGAAEMRALTMGSGFFEEDDLFSRQRERLVRASAWSKRVGGTPTTFGEQVKKEEAEERFAFSQLYKDFSRMGEWEKAFKSAEREAQQRLSIESPGHPLSSAGRGLSGMVPPDPIQVRDTLYHSTAIDKLESIASDKKIWPSRIPNEGFQGVSMGRVARPTSASVGTKPVIFEFSREDVGPTKPIAAPYGLEIGGFSKAGRGYEYEERTRGQALDATKARRILVDRSILEARHLPDDEDDPKYQEYLKKGYSKVKGELERIKTAGAKLGIPVEVVERKDLYKLRAMQRTTSTADLSGMVPPDDDAHPITKEIRAEAERNIRTIQAQRRASAAQVRSALGSLPGREGIFGTVDVKGSESDYEGSAGAPHVGPQATTTGTIKLPPEVRQQVSEEVRRALGSVPGSRYSTGPAGFSASTGQGAGSMPYSFSGTGSGAPPQPPPPPRPGFFARAFGGGGAQQPPNQPPFNPRASMPPPGGIFNQPPQGPPVPPGAAGGGGGLFGSSQGAYGGMGYGTIALLAYGAALRSLTVNMVEYAARTQTMELVTRQMAKANGLNTESVMAEVRAVQSYNITTQASHAVVQRMMMAQLDVAKAPQLAQVAQNISAVAGIPAPEAMERMVVGITSGYTRVLHQMGLQVSQVQSLRQLTAERHAEGLQGPPSEYEKRQALLNDVIIAGASAMGTYEKSLLTAGGQFTLLSRDAQETANVIGHEFLPTYGRFVSTLDSGLMAIQQHGSQAHTVLTGLLGLFTGLAASGGIALLSSLVARVGVGAALGGPVGLAVGAATAIGTYAVLNQDPVAAQVKTSQEVQDRMRKRSEDLQKERSQLLAMPDHTGQEWRTSWDANTEALRSVAESQADVQHNLTEQLAAEYNKRLKDFDGYAKGMEGRQKGDSLPTDKTAGSLLGWALHMVNPLASTGRTALGRRLAERSQSEAEVPTAPGSPEAAVKREAEAQRKEEARVGLLSPDLVNKDRQATQRILSEMIYAGGKIAKIDESYSEGGSKFKKAGEAFLSPRQKIQYDAREEIAETERLVKTVRDIQDRAAAGDPAARHRIGEINKYYGSPQAVERFLASTGSVAKQVREDEATSLAGLSRQTAAHIAQIREQVDLERVRAAVVKGTHQSEAQAIEAEFRVRQDTARRVLHISGDSDSYRKSVAQAQADRDSSVIRLAQQEREEQERRREDRAKDAGQFYRERALQAPTADYRSALMEGFDREMAATKAVTNEQQRTNEQVAITVKLRDDLVKLALEEKRAAAEGQVQRLRADVGVQDEVDRAINRRRRRGRNLDERDPYGEIQRTESRDVRLAQQEYELLQPVTPASGQRALAEQRDTGIYEARARARGEVVKQRAEDETVARTGQVEALELTSRGQQRVNEMRAFGYAEEQAAAYNNFNLQMGFIQAELDLRGRGLESEKATRKEVMQAEFELLEKEMETRRRSLEEQREFAGGLFDSLTSHGQIPVRQFLMDQLKGIDRTIFQNAFKEVAGGAWKSLGNIFPGQETTDAQGKRTPTFIGRLLSGTPLGVTHTEDIARLQADVTAKNTDAEVELTKAVQSLDEAIRGATGEQLGVGGSSGTASHAVPGSAGLGVLGTVGRAVQQLAQPGTPAAAPQQPTAPLGFAQEGPQSTAARGETVPPGTAQGAQGNLANLSGMPSMRLGPTDALAQGGASEIPRDDGSAGGAAPSGPVSPDAGIGIYGSGAPAPSDPNAPMSDFDASWKAAVAGEAKAFPQLAGRQSIFQQLAGAAVGGSFISSSFLMGRGSNDPSSQPSFSSHTPGHTVGGVGAPHGGGGMLGDLLSVGMIAGSMGLSQWANRRAKTPQFSPKLGTLMGLELPAVKSLEGAEEGGEGVGAEVAMLPPSPAPDMGDFVRLGPQSSTDLAQAPLAAPQPDSVDSASLDFAVASLPRSDVLADTFAQPDQGTSPDSTSLFNFGPKTNIFSDSMPQDQQVADAADPFANPLPQDQIISAPAIKELAAGLQGPTGATMPDRASGGFTAAFAQQALNTAASIATMFKPKDDGGGDGQGGGSYDNRPLDTSGGSDSGGSGSDSVGSDSVDSGDSGGIGGTLKVGLSPKNIAQEFAGVVQAIHGFSQGGARGDIAGVGGALTAIAPFTGPAAPFLMAGGMVANLVSGLFPDPKVQRQHDITTWMNQNKYVPPVTIENMDQSASGGVVDYGIGGKARDSGVGMFPLNVVQNQYRLGEEKNSGLFQSTHSYDPYVYLPGSTSINAGNRAGPQVTLSMPVSVSTMDSRSFLDNSGMITDAVNKELLAGNGISQTMTNAIFGMG